MLKKIKENYVNVVFFSLLAPFLLHHNLTSYYLTSRYRVQALYNSSKQGNVTVALYISGVLIKLTPNFSWEVECFLELQVCMYANGPSRTARLGRKLQWSFPGFRLHSIQYGGDVEDSRVALSAFPKVCKRTLENLYFQS